MGRVKEQVPVCGQQWALRAGAAQQDGTCTGAARRGLQGMHFQIDGQSHGEDSVSTGV